MRRGLFCAVTILDEKYDAAPAAAHVLKNCLRLELGILASVVISKTMSQQYGPIIGCVSTSGRSRLLDCGAGFANLLGMTLGMPGEDQQHLHPISRSEAGMIGC